jgi:Ca2+-binding EF-hand superfamily protein
MPAVANARGTVKPLVLAASLALAAGGLWGCGDDDESTTSADTSASETEQQTLDAFISEDFEAQDGDGDGSLDEAEAEAAIRQDFADTDVDGDGVLTIDDVQQELDEADGGEADQPLSAYLPYDSDGDGEITEEEYLAAVQKQTVKQMDADGDGEVTVEEAIAFHQEAATGKEGGK